MKIKDQPLDFRPREKLDRLGPENLSMDELIAIIISTGTKGKNAIEVGKDMLKKFGDGLLTTSVDDLAKIKGLGKVKAIKLKAAFEIGLRYANAISGKVIITNSKDVYILLHEYALKKQEHFLLLTLNARNQLIQKKVITVGTIDSSLFHPREIFAEAILDRASKIIVAHNHPSGNLEPSQNDILMTNKIREAGEILDIQLVDSVIISEEGYKSIIGEKSIL
jgi:DNA repair protein RadC